MDFKTGKAVEIVKEFLANSGDKFEINGIDLSKAVFMYRERNSSFIPIPRGNYTTNTENNSLYLNVIGDVKTKAYEYQVIYTSDMKAGKYLEEYPELKVLVSKYNDLVEDVTNIVKYAKTSGAKIDSLKMTQVLTQLEPNTFWVMNEDGKIVAFPLGNLNSKYEQMVSKLKKEVEELIKTTKETSLLDINNSAASKLNDLQNEVSKKLKELKTLSDSLKSNLSTAVAKYIDDNRDKLKGDRGPGITSITAVQDKVTVNYDDNKNTVFTVPTVAGRDGREIQDLSYANNKLKITMNDNTSKEVEIKNGINIKKVFDGKLSEGVKITLGVNWKICIVDYSNVQDKIQNTYIIIKDRDKILIVFGSGDLKTTLSITNNEFSLSNDFGALIIVEKIFVLE